MSKSCRDQMSGNFMIKFLSRERLPWGRCEICESKESKKESGSLLEASSFGREYRDDSCCEVVRIGNPGSGEKEELVSGFTTIWALCKCSMGQHRRGSSLTCIARVEKSILNPKVMRASSPRSPSAF